MSKIERLADRIVREMNRIDAGKSNGNRLDVLVDRYLAEVERINRMPA